MRAGLVGLVALAACGSATDTRREPAAVTVSVVYGGASAAVIEQRVVVPIEHALASVPGVRGIEAQLDEGHATIVVELANLAAVDVRIRDVQQAVTGVLPQLPPEVTPPVISRATRPPVLWLAVTGPQPAGFLSDVARDTIRMRLLRIAGVADVDVDGAIETVIAIRPDLGRLAAAGVTLRELQDAIRAHDLALPAGRVDATAAIVRVEGAVRDPAELATIVIGQRAEAPVRVGDVATIEETIEADAQPIGAPAAGADAPAVPRLGVRLQSRAAPSRVLAAVRAEVTALRRELPPGVRITETTAPASAPRPAPPLAVWVYGPELDVLADVADRLERELRAAGITDLVRTPGAGRLAHEVELDRARLAELGVSPAEVASTLRALVAGEHVGTLREGGRERAVMLRLATDRAQLPELLALAQVRGASGALVPLAAITRVTRDIAQPILRRDRERAIGLAIYATGAALATARELVAARTRELPAGYRAARAP